RHLGESRSNRRSIASTTLVGIRVLATVPASSVTKDRLAYEQAAGLYQQAVEVRAGAADTEPYRLLLAVARALWQAGELADARVVSRRVTAAATGMTDPRPGGQLAAGDFGPPHGVVGEPGSAHFGGQVVMGVSAGRPVPGSPRPSACSSSAPNPR